LSVSLMKLWVAPTATRLSSTFPFTFTPRS
jgi:hypothetical protein